ncbi:hypothetical protein B7P43_G01519 [Cryptotermes secundus]|uniref:Potassium channel domain-containing protein n=1 Tax=Cryptotermes secundus TaxID=105785 RepID=A0A2J7RES1_9NEOP|nr:hypothetical protein B7P43_G01519 [Cryptotermes secundus]
MLGNSRVAADLAAPQEGLSSKSYGNLAPQSEVGKVITIIYAIIGMPLFLLYLSNIGDIFAKSFKWTYAKCCLCQGCCEGASRRRSARRQQMALEHPASVGAFLGNDEWRVQYMVGADDVDSGQVAVRIERGAGENEATDSASSGESEPYDPQSVTVPITLCLAIMVGYICFGAVLFSEWEGWNFLDSSYFCFISLSTIGFGDIVPGERVIKSQEIELSFIFCSMYLMFGMALIAMCFNLMQEEVVHKMRSCMRSLKFIFSCKRRERRDDEDDVSGIR